MGKKDENGNKGRESMVFYKEWYENVSFMSEEEKYAFYDAVFRYAFYEEVSDLQPTVRLSFSFAKGQMERDWKKYDEATRKNAEISKKRSEAAKKGNNARWNKNETSQNVTNAEIRHNDNANNYDNADVNVPVYVGEEDEAEREGKDKNGIKNAEIPSLPPPPPLPPQPSLEEREEKFYKEVMEYSDEYDEDELENFFNYWSESDREQKEMRFEKEKTWNIKLRLKRWVDKPFY